MKKSKYKKKYWYMSVPGHRPMSWSGSSSRPWSWSAESLFGAWSWSGSGSLFGVCLVLTILLFLGLEKINEEE